MELVGRRNSAGVCRPGLARRRIPVDSADRVAAKGNTGSQRVCDGGWANSSLRAGYISQVAEDISQVIIRGSIYAQWLANGSSDKGTVCLHLISCNVPFFVA